MPREWPHVLILRTFSKAYGLAGLHVGYGFAAPDVVTALQRVSPPFGVNELGIVAAPRRSRPPTSWRSTSSGSSPSAGGVERALRCAGVAVPPSEANFVWLPVGPAAGRLAGALNGAGS